MGFHENSINVIRSLYTRVAHTLVWDGKLYPSAELLAGIRQGDPCSPLLMAIVSHLLFSLLKQVGIDAVAFADDFAIKISYFTFRAR